MQLWLILEIGKHEFLRNCEIALAFSRLVSSNALAMSITRTRSLGNWASVHEDRVGLYKLHPHHCPSPWVCGWQTIRTGAAVGLGQSVSSGKCTSWWMARGWGFAQVVLGTYSGTFQRRPNVLPRLTVPLNQMADAHHRLLNQLSWRSRSIFHFGSTSL